VLTAAVVYFASLGDEMSRIALCLAVMALCRMEG
jgi:hypothetical protein